MVSQITQEVQDNFMPSKAFDINFTAAIILRDFGMSHYDVIRVINFYGARTAFAAGKIARDYPLDRDVRSDLPYLLEAVHLFGETDVRELVESGLALPKLLTEYTMHNHRGSRLLLPQHSRPTSRDIAELTREEFISRFGPNRLDELGFSPVYVGHNMIVFGLAADSKSDSYYSMPLPNDLRNDRRKQRFGGAHGWRRNYRTARLALEGRKGVERATERTPIPRFVIHEKKPIKEKNVDRNFRPIGTNEILEYLGITTEFEKREYLRSFDGDPHYGADVIRAAYHLARFFGLRVNGDRATDEAKKMIIGIAYAVDRYSVPSTDSLLSAVGLGNLNLFKDFLPLNIRGKTSLVPADELGSIVFRIGQIPLKSVRGQLLMDSIGYRLRFVEGIRVYGL